MDSQFEKTRKFFGKEIVRGNLLYPDEYVIRFVKRNYKDAENTTILDFGCGTGRDSLALACEGYNMIAMDYTEESINIINKKKGDLPIKAIMNKGINIELEEKVDAIFADGSIFYNSKDSTVELLKNLKNVLTKDGLFWANWRSKRDSMYGKGIELEKDFYRLNAETKREGCSYLFCNEDDVKELYNLAGFKIKEINTLEYTENNGANRCAYIQVIAQNSDL